MEKIKELISKHKGLSVVVILSLVLFIIMLILFISMFFGGSSSKYGNRLDGIKEVKIDNNRLDGLNAKIEEYEEVEKCSSRIQGKIVYININFAESSKLDKAKEIAESALEEFSEDEISYYDFSFFLVQESEEEDGGFVVTGNKHPNKDNIGWIKS